MSPANLTWFSLWERGDHMKNTPIHIKSLHKSYPMGKEKLHVLKGIDLDVTEGEFIAILGPSGSGKSTLMNIIGCIDVMDEGVYELSGTSISTSSEDELASIRNKMVGFIFQKFNLLGKYTALDNVAMPLYFRGKSREQAHHQAENYLKMVGLDDRMHHKPNELSGGQQQRVAIARALCGEPSILLADEPTGNLDSKTGEEIMALIRNLHEQNYTIILITHDYNVALQADRIIHLKDGLIHKEENTKRMNRVIS